MWCRLKLDKGDSLLIGCVYRSPSSSVENCINMNNAIYEAVNLKDTHLLIIGDFNYPEINWEFQQTTENMQHNSSIFINCINDTFLYQHVKEHTRYRNDQNPSRLDLLLQMNK